MPRSNSSDWAVNDQVTAARLHDINEDLDDLYAYGSDRGRVVEAVSGTALRIDIGAHGYRVGEVHGVYAGGTDIAVTDDQTNYVMIDNTGTIQISTSGWDADYARLAIVVAASGAITSIALHRPDVFGGDLGKNNDTIAASETLAATKTLTLSDEEQLVFNCNGDSRIVNLPTSAIPTGRYFRIENATSYDDGGALMIHESGTQIWVISAQNVAYFMYNGTAWEVFAHDSNHEYFGNGADEEYTLDASQAAVGGLFSKSSNVFTLLRDAEFVDLHIATTYQLDTNGFKFTCIGILDPQGSGENQIISNGGDGGDGGNGDTSGGTTGGTAGTAGAAAHSGGSLADPAAGDAGTAGANGSRTSGADGANSSNTTGETVTQSIGSNGVTGGVGGTGGTSGVPSHVGGDGGTSTGGTATEITSSEMLFNSRIQSACWTADPTANGHGGSAGGTGGGAGGGDSQFGSVDTGGGGGGGGSGANGGNMYFGAVTIRGAGKVQALGGDGGDGGDGSDGSGSGGVHGAGGGGAGGGGAGGMGGFIVAYYRSKANWSGSFDVSGGSAGSGGSGGTGYNSGNPGGSASSATAGSSGIVHEYQL